MKGRKTWERGYAAGLIDGEGCIQIKRINARIGRNTEYSLAININMTDKEALDFMFGVFGGKIYSFDGYETKDGKPRLPVFRWEITRRPALKFLKQILSFLKVKKIQAELGIRFQLLREKSEKIYCDLGSQKPIPQYLLDQFESFYQEMKQLKTSSAAVTTKRDDPQLEGSDSLVLQEK